MRRRHAEDDNDHLFVDAVVDVINVAVERMHFQRTVKTLSMIVQRQLNVSPPANWPRSTMLTSTFVLTAIVIIYKTLANCQPSYLYNLLQVYHPSRALRSSPQQLLHVPYMSTDFGRRAFSYSSPATWNSIPISIKNCSSLYSFKRHLKSYFIAQLTNN